jgi:hypothetical protein
MAVSLWPNQAKEVLERERSRINNLFGEIDITFYDSTSIFDFEGNYSYLEK